MAEFARFGQRHQIGEREHLAAAELAPRFNQAAIRFIAEQERV